jgi:hypothetical protein
LSLGGGSGIKNIKKPKICSVGKQISGRKNHVHWIAAIFKTVDRLCILDRKWDSKAKIQNPFS